MPAFHRAVRSRTGSTPIHEEVVQEPQHITLCGGPAQTMLALELNPTALTLAYRSVPGVLHYFRLADATLIPLPPEHEPTRHKPGRPQGAPLQFAAGDAYIAVSPGVARITDSPTVARFLHLRDYFNAEKLADALLTHLLELAGAAEIPEDVTVLVVEAR
jgi:hypothetical protein